jgi:hypothetical protein
LSQKKKEFVSRKEISLVYFRLFGSQGVNLDLRASPGKDLKRVVWSLDDHGGKCNVENCKKK